MNGKMHGRRRPPQHTRSQETKEKKMREAQNACQNHKQQQQKLEADEEKLPQSNDRTAILSFFFLSVSLPVLSSDYAAISRTIYAMWMWVYIYVCVDLEIYKCEK
jgi:hypothetical protein